MGETQGENSTHRDHRLRQRLRRSQPIPNPCNLGGVESSGSDYAEANPAMDATYHRETPALAKV
jgi:hypothetical protein